MDLEQKPDETREAGADSLDPDRPRTELPNPFLAALLMRCPNCCKGGLFSGFLGIRKSCDHCGLDYSVLDTGDGPAFFVMVLVSVLVILPAFALEMFVSPPYWVYAVIFLPLMILLPLALLRPFKALMFALQYRYKAEPMGGKNATLGESDKGTGE